MVISFHEFCRKYIIHKHDIANESLHQGFKIRISIIHDLSLGRFDVSIKEYMYDWIMCKTET